MNGGNFAKLVVRSQAIIYITLLVCILIAPASLSANSGISYFGHHRSTVVPFMVGFLTADYFLFKAAKLINRINKLKFLYRSLVVIVASLVGIVIAPAIGNGWIDFLHRIFGSLIFITQLTISAWVLVRLNQDRLNWLFYILQWASGILAFIYLSPAQGFSIEAQILFQLSFSVVLLRSLGPLGRLSAAKNQA